MAIQLTSSTDKHMYCTGVGFKTNTLPYSITVWINAVWNGAARLSFVGMYDGTPTLTGTPTVGLQIGTSAGAGEVSCWTYGGAVLVTSANGVMTASNNTWVLVTYVWDGTNHYIYRNDTQVATSTTAIVVGTFTQIYINGYPPGGTTNETSTFQVDSYTYYSRALSPTEIQTIYNSAGARNGLEYGQIARYEFDEDAEGVTVSTCVDMTGNGSTLVPTGAGTPITFTYIGTVANQNTRTVIS